jgi:hypothetical protein
MVRVFVLVRRGAPGGGSNARESVAEQAKRRLLVVEESVVLA